jgi:PPE-repeat protein
LLSLLQGNILGQNNAAIAAAEAEYAQFWAQDVAAITGYAGSSQAATTGLGSFTQAPQTTNDSGQAAQSAATTAASAATTPTGLEGLLEQIEAVSTNFLNQVSSVNADYTKFFTTALGSIPGGSQLATTWTNLYSFISGAGSQATWTNVANSSTSLSIGQWKNFFIYQPWSHGVALGSLNGGLSSPGGHLGAGLGAGARAATAALGTAQAVGKLSVPPSWAGATPAIRLAATSLTDSAFAATAAPTMDIPLSALNQASLGSLAGGALGSPASRVVTSTGVRAKVTAPARTKGPIPLDKVIARLQEQPDQVQHWNVDEAGLDDLVAKLSTKPGIHAVHVTDDKASAVAAKPATG